MSVFKIHNCCLICMLLLYIPLVYFTNAVSRISRSGYFMLFSVATRLFVNNHNINLFKSEGQFVLIEQRL